MDVIQIADDDVGLHSDKVTVELTVEALPVIHDGDGHQRAVADEIAVAHDEVRRGSWYAATDEELELLAAQSVAAGHQADGQDHHQERRQVATEEDQGSTGGSCSSCSSCSSYSSCSSCSSCSSWQGWVSILDDVVLGRRRQFQVARDERDDHGQARWFTEINRNNEARVIK